MNIKNFFKTTRKMEMFFRTIVLYSIAIAYTVIHFLSGADPVEALLEGSGYVTINLLGLSLVSTTLLKFRKTQLLIGFPKIAGYAALWSGLTHLLIYLVLDQGLAVEAIVSDLIKHPRIIAGGVAIIGLMLAGLAGIRKFVSMRRILLRFSYPASLFASYHYWEAVKFDRTIPAIYLVLFVSIVFVRIMILFKPRPRQ